MLHIINMRRPFFTWNILCISISDFTQLSCSPARASYRCLDIKKLIVVKELKSHKSTSRTQEVPTQQYVMDWNASWLALHGIRYWSDERSHYHAPTLHLHDRPGVGVQDQSFIYCFHRASRTTGDDICMANRATHCSHIHVWLLHHWINMLSITIPSNPPTQT